ncbi:MAG: hypothetical protein ACRDOL_32835 [Streptosporangiaceae bacterium]
MTSAGAPERTALLRRGFMLEYVTLGWNVAGIIVLAFAAIAARSVALAGFGLDSLIEVGASTVVIWELSGTGQDRQRHGLARRSSRLARTSIWRTSAVAGTGSPMRPGAWIWCRRPLSMCA